MKITPREVAIQWFERVWKQRSKEAIYELMSENAIAHQEGGGSTTGPSEFSQFHDQILSAFIEPQSALGAAELGVRSNNNKLPMTTTFAKQLTEYRKQLGLTQEQAAKNLGIAVVAYKDREDDRANCNFVERFGLLVGLGMDLDLAKKIAGEPDVYSFDSLTERSFENVFIKETPDSYILISRSSDFFEYPILKERVASAENILGWIDHLSEKSWVTTDHISSLIYFATQNLKIKIHPV